jgi:hypothetical protein
MWRMLAPVNAGEYDPRMAPLRNLRHEAFARAAVEAVARGETPTAAYRQVYGADGHGAENSSSRLMKKDEVRDRMSELLGAVAKKSAVSVASLIEELEQVRCGAEDDKQFSAAAQAVLGKGKLAGLLRDKVEIVTPLAACHSLADVVGYLVSEVADGDEHKLLDLLDAVRSIVIDRLAEHALPAPE